MLLMLCSIRIAVGIALVSRTLVFKTVGLLRLSLFFTRKEEKGELRFYNIFIRGFGQVASPKLGIRRSWIHMVYLAPANV